MPLSSREIEITDHALARLIERHLRMSRRDIVRTVLPEAAVEMVNASGGSCTYESDGLKYVFENYHLVTVLAANMKSRHDHYTTNRRAKRNSRTEIEKFKKRRGSKDDTA